MPILSPIGAATSGAFGLPKSAAGGGAGDPYYNYVTMLLTGNGTNGGQNNTFLDSSTNAFSITRNGNTTQGSFSPYGSLWSNYFTSSNADSVKVSSGIFSASSNWTAECWCYADGSSGTGTLTLFGGNGSNGIVIYVGTSGQIGIETGNGAYADVANSTFSFNTWNHVAVTKSSGTYTIYLNGVAKSFSSTSGTLSSSLTTTETWVGNSSFYASIGFQGYISNARIVNSVIYSSNFTPSTTPLTAISGTQLLTCQSNRFIDNSSNAFALTVGGTPSVQRFSPFNPTASYDTATIGGSGYFDGTGDYLSIAANSAFAYGTGDYTLEYWIYTKDTPSVYWGVGSWYYGSPSDLAVFVNGSNGITVSWSGGGFTSTGGEIKPNTWNYVAVSRVSGTTRLYINGTLNNSSSTSYNVGQNYNFAISGDGGSGEPSTYLNGYIGDVRVVKGTGLYSGSTMTVPTAPLSVVSGTSLLTSMTNASIADYAMMNNIETRGNAQVSTSVKKFGTGSIAITSSGDGLIPNSTIVLAGYTGNFTYECWFYLNSIGATQYILDDRLSSSTTANMNVYISTTGQLRVRGLSTNDYIVGGYVTAGNWYHFALCKAGNSLKAFINGTQSGSTYTDTNTYIVYANRPIIGATYLLTSPLNGYIDDFRITRGYARYTTDFTPPTAAFPTF